MKTKIKSIFALVLAILMLLSLASCGQSCGQTVASNDDTIADTSAVSEVETRGVVTNNGTTADTQGLPEDMTQGEADTYEPFVKEPLTHMIFGAKSYAQGDNLIGEISGEALPATATLPHTMIIRTYEQWQNFYGGMPRIQMDGGFTTGLAAINQNFFDKKAVAVIIVGESSPDYTHVVGEVEVKQGALYVELTTQMTEGAVKETAYRCIMIPIDRAYAGLNVRVEHTRELNG